MKRTVYLSLTLTLLVGALLMIPSDAFSHCDTLDGPVIKDAKAALAAKDVTPALKWVRAQDEAEIRDAFNKTLAVRSKGDAARDLADTYFFETLVRVHRAGEGAPYTGLKPAGSMAHIEAAADESLESGSPDEIVNHLTKAMTDGIRDRYAKVKAAKVKSGKSVAEGREYVHAYVEYLHYVAGLFDQITKGGAHAHGEAAHEEAQEK